MAGDGRDQGGRDGSRGASGRWTSSPCRIAGSWPTGPTSWRERWGRRANDLEDSGLSWRDAEGRAFVEIYGQVRAATKVERN